MDDPARRAPYPEYVKFALSCIDFADEEEQEEFINSFLGHWGDFSLDAFGRVLRQSDEIDEEKEWERLFVLFGAGHAKDAQGVTLILPYLESTRPKERWASAISMGVSGDRRAVPTLCVMLTEFLPTSLSEKQKPSPDDWFFFKYRGWAPSLLGQMGDQRAVPALRQACVYLVALLDQDTGSPYNVFGKDVSPFVRSALLFEATILYALGRLNAFGALAGIAGAKPYLLNWSVQMVMGAMHGNYSWETLLEWSFRPEFLQALRDNLDAWFGWTVEEREQAITYYDAAGLAYSAMMSVKEDQQEIAHH
jgi:PBS lyase HEAT-like repeat